MESKLVEDITVECDNGNDCPKGLICEKNTCKNPGPSSVYVVRGKNKYPISYKFDHTFHKSF